MISQTKSEPGSCVNHPHLPLDVLTCSLHHFVEFGFYVELWMSCFDAFQFNSYLLSRTNIGTCPKNKIYTVVVGFILMTTDAFQTSNMYYSYPNRCPQRSHFQFSDLVCTCFPRGAPFLKLGTNVTEQWKHKHLASKQPCQKQSRKIQIQQKD